MQRTTIALAGAAFFAAASTAQAGSEIQPRDGWIITEIPHVYADTYPIVKEVVKASPLNVVTRASATVGAKSLGRTIPGNMVVGLYGPQFAVRMLDASVQAGIEAPLRLYITESEAGAVTLSYKQPSVVFGAYEDDGGEALMTMAAELDQIFADIVQAVVNH